MTNRYLPILLSISAFIVAILIFGSLDKKYKKEFSTQPSEWFHFQRAFPEVDFPVEEYIKAINTKNEMSDLAMSGNRTWEEIGPFNIGGRITALDYDPTNNILYAGAAAGGILKSIDYGLSWDFKTDFLPGLSVGAIVIDPNNPAVIYCGTGEANISTDSYAGFGMLKSTDYGETWVLSGLEDSRHIAEIEVHPLNSDLILAAVSGGLYSKDNNRGIYKSTDAGNSWQNILFLSDSVSAIDVAVDPTDQNIIYAAMWERLRGPSFRKAAGVSSGIYKSTDGGNTWDQLLNGLPSPDPTIGRISIAVAPSNPNVVYTLYKESNSPNGSDNRFSSFFISTDKGNSWNEKFSTLLSNEFSSFGWYFGVIEVDPADHNTVYVADVDLFKSTDAGTSWDNITNSYSGGFNSQHPDQHALWIDQVNSDKLIVGNDGGIFTTISGGAPWTKSYALPISQFYASTIDYLQPEVKIGGTQDNGTLRTPDGGLDNWDHIYGGDGFHTIVDYTNSNIIYAESQFGGIGKSTNGGSSFNYIGNGISGRANWSTPYTMDLINPNILYLGTHLLFRTTNGGSSWSSISSDLTRGPNGRLGTITCVSTAIESDGTTRTIYVGTDDAKLSLSTNSGVTWNDVTGPLPNRYMTDVLTDKRNPATAYVTLSGYNLDERNPHIFRTTNYGSNWQDITGNLPDVPVNSIIIDYDYDSVLYAGTDVGVFMASDLGSNWSVLGDGLPNSPIFDLNYHQPTKILVAATHGRSMYQIDISNITNINEDVNYFEKKFVLGQNYPNPFNPGTKISWQSPVSSHQTLKIFDVLGNEMAVLVDEYKPAGSYEINFDASGLPSGIYFYRLETDNFVQTKKMLLIK